MTQLTGLLELSLAFKQRPCKEFGAGSIGLRFGVGSLAHLLKNRFYIGEITYRGEVRSGKDEPILGRDLFERSRWDRAPYTLWRDQGLLIATEGNTTDFKFIEAARSCATSRTKGCRWSSSARAFRDHSRLRELYLLARCLCHDWEWRTLWRNKHPRDHRKIRC